MLATFVVAWRTVTKRLFADWLVVGAVFVSVLLAAALLAAGPIYADAVTSSALQKTIADAPAPTSTITAELRVFPDEYGESERVARGVLKDVLETTGGDTYAHIDADAYGLADPTEPGITELASFQYFEGIEERARLSMGAWPEAGGEPVQVAMPIPTANALDLDLGDTFGVENRLDPTITTTAVVVGLVSFDDPTAQYWLEDPLIVQGQVESGTFRTYGPMLVTRETMLAHLTPLRVNAEWRGLPDAEGLTVAEVGRFQEAIEIAEHNLNLELTRSLGERSSSTSGFGVATEMPTLLGNVDNSLTVTRSSVLALLVQLAFLAGYAVVLATGLLADTRTIETALVRSRGSSPRQILGTATLEALVIAIPAGVAAPFLATWLLRLLNSIGPLAAVDLTIDPLITNEAYVLAFVAALMSVIVLAWSAYRSARQFPGGSRRGERQATRPISQRVGLDIALVLLTVAAFWQLRELGSDVSARVRGQFGVDPLLVLAPALGLLAGAVLALRMIPLVARGAERVASSRMGAVPALASWQVARRPRRYTRSSLLLIMTIGIGLFATSYSTTWARSQRDQAAFENGADIRVTPQHGQLAIDPIHIRTAHESLAGVSHSMPVRTSLGQFERSSELGQVVLVDAEVATDVVDLRPDLAPDFGEHMTEIVQRRPRLGSIELPGEPSEIAFEIEVVEIIPSEEDFQPCDFLAEGEEPDLDEVCFDADIAVVVEDGDGLIHRVRAGDVLVNAGPQDVTASLTHAVSGGSSITPRYPLHLVAIELRSQLPQLSSRDVQLTLSEVSIRNNETFDPVAVDFRSSAWALSTITVGNRQVSPSLGPRSTGPSDRLVLAMQTGAGPGEPIGFFGIRPRGTQLPDTIPVVVSSSPLETLGVHPGETVRLTPLRLAVNAQVVGTMEAFPTTDPDLGGVILADLPTYQTMQYRLGESIPGPEEHWLTSSDESTVTPGDLLASPINSLRVTSKQEIVDRLTADPVALATIGALTVGFVAAAVFSVVGFAVTATVAARERLVEFALIRAIGMSRRRVGSWLTLEQGALVILSLLLGTVLGVVLTAVLLPLVILTQAGLPPQPPSLVTYPWDTILGLEVAVVAALAVVVALMTVLLRRIGLGSLLRMGED